MERQRRSKSAVFLAGFVCVLFAAGAHGQSRFLSCEVGTGVSDASSDPERGTQYGIDCYYRYAEAWINCPEGVTKRCHGDYKATADAYGVVCYDSGGTLSIDSPKYCSRNGLSGGGGCALVLQGPQETVATTVDGELRTVALPKSSFVLSRTEAGEEENVSFLMEEWAVIGTSTRPGEAKPRLKVLNASSPEFAMAKSKDLEQIARTTKKRKATASEETLLIVESPVHPHNSRFAPTPRLGLADTQVPSGMSPAAVLVRADFSEKEDSPRQLQILHAKGPVPQELMDLLKDRLELDRRSMKRHRTIVFALVRIGDAIELTSLATVMPKCCCGGIHCV